MMRATGRANRRKVEQMIKKIAGITLVVAGAAAAGIFLGWHVTSPLQKSSAAAFAPVQAGAAPERQAAAPERAQPTPAPAAQAVKPEARMEPTGGEAPTGLRLETKTTKIVFDPLRGRVSLDVTPKFNITLDAQKREAGLSAGSVYLGTAR
jgi:hypothetical protein